MLWRRGKEICEIENFKLEYMLNATSVKNNFLLKRIKDKSIFSDFSTLFNSYPHIIELFDSTGNRLYTNRCLQFQYDRPDDQDEYNILHDQKVIDSEFYQVLIDVFNGEMKVIQSNALYENFFPWYESERIYELTIFPIRENESSVNYFAIIHSKIQSLLSDSSFAEEEKRKIENEMAYSFLRNVSHELRTPLNWILGFSELISGENSIEKIKEYNQTISKGGNLLLALIEKLLEMSTIVNNKVELNKSEFEVNSILDEIHGLIKNELTFIGRNLKIEIVKRLNDDEKWIVSDRMMLKQILLNLVHNSVKFTKEGTIELRVEKVSSDEIKFSVKDSGIGIDTLKQKSIFEVFNKANEVDINEQYGLGLGLTISGNYVKKLGGHIWVDSEVGVGSTFNFTIKTFDEEFKTKEKYIFLE